MGADDLFKDKVYKGIATSHTSDTAPADSHNFAEDKSLPMISIDFANIFHAGMILLGAWCCRQTFTSPTSSANRAAQKKYKEYKAADPIVVSARLAGDLYQAFYYMLNVGELVSVLGLKISYDYFPDVIRFLFHPSKTLYISSPERMIGLAMIVAGTMVRLSCYRHMKKSFTFELAIRDGHTLVTTGPYAYVRHPANAGGALVVVACMLFNLGRGSWWAECVFASPGSPPWLILGLFHIAWGTFLPYAAVARSQVEDRVLKEHFKEEWVEWAKKTPYRMIPWLF